MWRQAFMVSSIGQVKHGMSRSPTYAIWHGMKDRCTRERSTAWKWYGARGIKVCDRWMNSFENFLADMGERPEGKMIERINNDGHYEPGNCKWADIDEQLANRRVTLRFDVDGQVKTLEQLADEMGMNKNTLWARLNIGLSVEEALTKPLLGYATHCKRGHLYAMTRKRNDGQKRRCCGECVKIRQAIRR